MSTKADVERVAREVCQQFAADNRGLLHYGRVTINLRDTAMCARFVREVHEAALQTAEYTWEFRAANAREMERKLRAAGKEISRAEAKPGDVVMFNNGAGSFGHTGIVLGSDTYAENTSSESRGPGFVVSTFAEIGEHRISGWYSVLPSELPFRVSVLGHYLPAEAGEIRDDDHTWVRLNELAAAMGWYPPVYKREINKTFVKARQP